MPVVATLVKERKLKGREGVRHRVARQAQGQTRPAPQGTVEPLELEWPFRVVPSWTKMTGLFIPTSITVYG